MESPVEPAARTLVFHGTLVLLIGLLCGVPYGRAINAGAPAHRVSAWRLTHLSLPLGAILMFAVAPLLTPFAVAASLKQLMAGLLIVSGYAFCVALPLAAITGERGLSARGPFPARIVFLANMLGVVTSLLASLALVYAAYRSL